ncbi:hypothetical protein Naga_101534g2 [Nannochloropsis gaditana]|uniref:Uncharacterized protein n=1 Tax=Nannochloropsis gaditana TaxID=72520 RepID=W7TZG4_9STRA|nr:hypothetical protein Naga_101534g2 [Nannochloropsis gaditana]
MKDRVSTLRAWKAAIGFLVVSTAMLPIGAGAHPPIERHLSDSSIRPPATFLRASHHKYTPTAVLSTPWQRLLLEDANCSTLASTCTSCLSLPPLREGEACVWCPGEGGCVASAACTDARDSCREGGRGGGREEGREGGRVAKRRSMGRE